MYHGNGAVYFVQGAQDGKDDGVISAQSNDSGMDLTVERRGFGGRGFVHDGARKKGGIGDFHLIYCERIVERTNRDLE